MARETKAKREVSMEEALWKSADKLDEIDRIDTISDPEHDVISRVYEYFLGEVCAGSRKR